MKLHEIKIPISAEFARALDAADALGVRYSVDLTRDAFGGYLVVATFCAAGAALDAKMLEEYQATEAPSQRIAGAPEQAVEMAVVDGEAESEGPAASGGIWCAARHEHDGSIVYCTRPHRHGGRHVAHGSFGRVLAAWTEDTPAPLERAS